MEYIDITSKNRKLDEMYSKYGYTRDIREESIDLFRIDKRFTDNGDLLFTHYIKDRALFTEYFDTERKLWVYKPLEPVKE